MQVGNVKGVLICCLLHIAHVTLNCTPAISGVMNIIKSMNLVTWFDVSVVQRSWNVKHFQANNHMGRGVYLFPIPCRGNLNRLPLMTL